ncbi:hypothetical protein Scep_029972 [Stephania cephalantha]|uniref:Uncharacterized protein n=1 Tax=Stephania cephalantha TaxID=152367 RepID=A0AAP0DYS3_9MAGN
MKMNTGEQVVVVQMTKGNVKTRDILNTLKQRDVNNVSTMKQYTMQDMIAPNR